ncbi:outer membrane protein assembly factor BamB [Endozoicomonas sp. OPT23]|uniref:outer membrane protein assembly factor BamB n=1 Tax=Endozoicomonas sp. OPT23 TaxID=2072845 RepID=UPI00129A7192|nr:outer membrane protein assembly factor BamB [Endozoicomonas sp. OPT23]MRI35065.1 outer membrane protein assembly factor BamB [Endozoicomonas sp. OPT23]
MMERICRLAVVVALGMSVTACSMFSSDEEEVRKPKSLTEFKADVELTEVWSKGIGEGTRGSLERLVPSISGNVIYTVGADGEVTALNRETGKVLWNKELKLKVSGGITADAGLLLFGTLNGRLVALKETDGTLLWNISVSSEVISSPQTNGQIVIVQSIDDTVAAYDATDGKQLWRQENLQPALTLRGTSTPRIEGEAVFVGLSNGEAKAFRMTDGAPLWSSRVSIPKGTSELERMVDIKAQPLIVGDSIFLVSFQGNAAAMDKYSGRVKWTRELSSYKTISEGFGSLYLTDDSSYVSSLDQRSGAVSWRQDKLEYRLLTAPVTYSSYVAVGDAEGYVHLMSQVDGGLAGRYKVGGAIKAPLTVGGDYLYVLNADGKLTALKQK